MSTSSPPLAASLRPSALSRRYRGSATSVKTRRFAAFRKARPALRWRRQASPSTLMMPWPNRSHERDLTKAPLANTPSLRSTKSTLAGALMMTPVPTVGTATCSVWCGKRRSHDANQASRSWRGRRKCRALPRSGRLLGALRSGAPLRRIGARRCVGKRRRRGMAMAMARRRVWVWGRRPRRAMAGR